jgi:hypothetical protein
MRGMLSLIAVLLVFSACCGCLAPPNVVHPGSVDYQQARARIFEPYPENEPGPPIVGARPREYQNPVAEPDRVMPRPGETILWPVPQACAQPPLAQPPIITSPPQVLGPPSAQPVGP